MKKRWLRILSKCVLAVVVIIYAIPLYIAVVNSVKPYSEIVLSPR